MKTFCFTVDDNIRFLKEINEKRPNSIFEHPYLNMYRRLHEKFGIKVQLNLFYETEGFTLSDMTDKYISEWKSNANWLKLSFHSRLENVKPYEFSDYFEVYNDCSAVNFEIIRFASKENLAKTTTIHYCLTTEEGIKAVEDNDVIGLLGLYGTCENPCTSYQINFSEAERIRNGNIVHKGVISYAPIDIILNDTPPVEISRKLKKLKNREHIWVMIHEQYFYPDYHRYIENFEELLADTFKELMQNGFKSRFFEELL